MRPTVARLRRASAQQEDRRYASQSGPSNEPPFLQRSFGAGVPRLRSVDQSPVASVFAFFTAFLVLWPAVLAQFPLSFCQRFRQSLSFFLRLSRQPP